MQCKYCEASIHWDEETQAWEDTDGDLSCRPWDTKPQRHEPSAPDVGEGGMTMNVATWTCWRDPSHQGIDPHPQFGWPRCTECGAAPAYHERPDHLPAGLTVNVYVPTPGPRASDNLAPRSAVVGLPTEGGVDVYFEGWTNGPAQYGGRDARGLWEAGVEHAASRMVTAYPTTARRFVPPGDVLQVGTYEVATRVVTVTDEVALDDWLEGR